MSETGTIVGVQGDRVFVEMEASKECEACGACRYTKTGRMLATMTNSLGAGVGDTVKIDIEPRLVLVAAFVVYILPIAFFFFGYALGVWAGRLFGLDSGRLGIGGGLVFLVLAYATVRVVDSRARINLRFEPKMYAIIRKN